MQKYLLIIIILLVSCTAKKKTTELETLPDWVKQKPYIAGFYTGVGSVKKIGTSSEYVAKARQAALADMAEEISSNVSATSVLHTIETQYGVSETYDQKIEVTSSDYFEGFEPVAFFETEDSYWVYFKIGQSTYHEMKEKKKQEAIAAATAKYQSGLQEQLANKPKEAFSFYLQGLQAIKAYLNEETPALVNNKSVDIGNELYSAANQILTDLEIKSDVSEVFIKRGKELDKPLIFKVYYKKKPVQGIPVEFSFSGGYLKNDRQSTDIEGKVQLGSQSIYSKNSKEQITAAINLKDLAQKAVDDPFIRGLILKRSLKPVVVTINIASPTLSLIMDKNDCSTNDCQRITSSFNQIANELGYKVSNKSDADYLFDLKFSSVQGESAGAFTSVYIVTEINVTDKTNKIIYSRKTEDIKGVGRSTTEANEKAFNELVNTLNRILLRQAIDNIK
ncbi:MAG: LPP20 family lipoprotein [Bacteroidales bacterium]